MNAIGSHIYWGRTLLRESGRAFLILLFLASLLLASPFSYRLLFYAENTGIEINRTTPLNYQNRLLPQPRYTSLHSLLTDASWGALTASYRFQGVFSSLEKPQWKGTLREMYLTIPLFSSMEISLGRKILKWGTGYAFNPTGVVEPIRDPSDPSDRLRQFSGLDMVEWNYFGDWLTLSAVFAAQARWNRLGWQNNHNQLALRTNLLAGATEVSLIYTIAQGRKARAGFNFSQVIGDNLEVHGEWIGKLGSQHRYHRVLLGEIPPPDASDPYVMPYAESRKLFHQAVIGFQYTFKQGTNLAGEYYFNSEGLSGAQWERWFSYVSGLEAQRKTNPALADLAGYEVLQALRTLNPRGTQKHYLFARLFHEWPWLSLEIIQFLNLQDKSRVLIPTATIQLSSRFLAYLRFTHFSGSARSEYGALFYRWQFSMGWQLYL